MRPSRVVGYTWFVIYTVAVVASTLSAVSIWPEPWLGLLVSAVALAVIALRWCFVVSPVMVPGSSARAPVRRLSTPEPAPRPNATGRKIWDLVVEDMRDRDATGARKYGQRLTAGDGRNSLVDAYQEVLDLAVYLRKEIEERGNDDK